MSQTTNDAYSRTADRPQFPKTKAVTTPRARLLFPHVVEVDYGTDDYPCKEGRFATSFLLTEADAAAFRAKLEPLYEHVTRCAEAEFNTLKPAQRKKLGDYSIVELGEDDFDRDGNPTGLVSFRCKTGAFYEQRDGSRKQRVIPMFDGMAQRVTLGEDPGNGTEARLSVTPGYYFVNATGQAGLTLYLNAVQILKLVKRGERDAGDYGFEACDDPDEVFSATTDAGEAGTEAPLAEPEEKAETTNAGDF